MTHREDGSEKFRWLRALGVFLIAASISIAGLKGIDTLIDWWLS